MKNKAFEWWFQYNYPHIGIETMADGRYREMETRIAYAAWKAREEMAHNERQPAKSGWRTLLNW